MQALSGRPVETDQWKSLTGNAMPHIELTRNADAVIVAPATADFLAKLAHGLADDLLATLALARDPARTPLLVAPAMNVEMWDNPATQRNLAQLRADGIVILGPASGAQACGETGLGRMLEAHELLEDIVAFFPAEAAGRQKGAADRGSDVRTDRSGARRHQFVVGQDRFRAGACRTRRRRTGHADRGTDGACDTPRRAAHRRARQRSK